ncbi:hypothetical protein N4G69_13920 [Streptomyces mirabilis]|uniref:hypothetical protein n=1 Tax=Streptomyces mirabilis TaxID=68239 RepID=UPI0021C1AE82|nr:hypothetical protein [Streptomyces mirabilis]MCT9106721.1 hypothetical protein [Streptomyces mirabilis]
MRLPKMQLHDRARACWPVAIKPTAATREGSCYRCPESAFVPDRETMRRLVRAWSDTAETSAAGIVARGEDICQRLNINILGGVFLAFLEEHHDLAFSRLLTAYVDERRSDIIRLLYADLDDHPPGDPRCRRVYRNNQGRFLVLQAETRHLEVSVLARLLNEEKKRYRKAVITHVPRRDTTAGDHLIHVPNDCDEAVHHVGALASAVVEFP